jgi:hypothetical protein
LATERFHRLKHPGLRPEGRPERLPSCMRPVRAMKGLLQYRITRRCSPNCLDCISPSRFPSVAGAPSGKSVTAAGSGARPSRRAVDCCAAAPYPATPAAGEWTLGGNCCFAAPTDVKKSQRPAAAAAVKNCPTWLSPRLSTGWGILTHPARSGGQRAVDNHRQSRTSHQKKFGVTDDACSCHCA